MIRKSQSKIGLSQAGWNNRAWMKQAQAETDMVRAAATPRVGITANFDPDQTMLTPAMQGFVNMQIGNGSGVTNILTPQADYGTTGLYQNPQTLQNKYPFSGGRDLRAIPGQPTLVYPVPSGGGQNPNLASFMRGGKAQPYREYPGYPIAGYRFGAYQSSRGAVLSEVCYRADANHIKYKPDTWHSNSPLPPGARFVELNDIRWWNTPGYLLPNLLSLADTAHLFGIEVADLDQILPQTIDHRIFGNVRQLTGNDYAVSFFGSNDAAIHGDDTYWTGTVKNPLDWVDSWWYGTNNNIDKDLMKTWLDTHPGAKLG